MPRKALTPRRQRQGQLTVAVERRLLTGHWFPMGSEGFPEPSESELEALWETHRDTLMRKWFAGYEGEGGAFTRPWAWWAFDAPEPRRLLSGTCEPADKSLWFGVPAAWGKTVKPVWESERGYLRRKNLLTNTEIESARRKDRVEKTQKAKAKTVA